MLARVLGRQEATMARQAKALIVLVRFIVIEDFDDLLAVATDHHRIVLSVHLNRSSATFEQFGTFILDFDCDRSRTWLRVQFTMFKVHHRIDSLSTNIPGATDFTAQRLYSNFTAHLCKRGIIPRPPA